MQKFVSDFSIFKNMFTIQWLRFIYLNENNNKNQEKNKIFESCLKNVFSLQTSNKYYIEWMWDRYVEWCIKTARSITSVFFHSKYQSIFLLNNFSYKIIAKFWEYSIAIILLKDKGNIFLIEFLMTSCTFSSILPSYLYTLFMILSAT